MPVPLGFSTKEMFLSLGPKLFQFQGPAQQATPLSPPPLYAATAPCPPTAAPPSRRLCVSQSASACVKGTKSPPLVARLVQDGCGCSEREGRLLCASNVCFYAGFMQARAGTREERSVPGEKGSAYPGVVLRRLGSIGEPPTFNCICM